MRNHKTGAQLLALLGIFSYLGVILFAAPSQWLYKIAIWFTSLLDKYHEPLSFYACPVNQISKEIFVLLVVLSLPLLLVLLRDIFQHRSRAVTSVVIAVYTSTVAWTMWLGHSIFKFFNHSFSIDKHFWICVAATFFIQTILLLLAVNRYRAAENNNSGRSSQPCVVLMILMIGLCYLGFTGINVPRQIVLNSCNVNNEVGQILQVANRGEKAFCKLHIECQKPVSEKDDTSIIVDSHFVMDHQGIKEFGSKELSTLIGSDSEGYIAVKGFPKRIGFKFLKGGSFSTWAEKDTDTDFSFIPFTVKVRDAMLGGLALDITNLNEYETIAGDIKLVDSSNQEEPKTIRFSINPKTQSAFGKIEFLRLIKSGDIIYIHLDGYERNFRCNVVDQNTVTISEE